MNTQNKMTTDNETITLSLDIAKAIAERMREEIEHAAEKAADYRIMASNLTIAGLKQESAEACAVFLARAEENERKAKRWDADFKSLERICIALTDAGA
jgi:hypothetical protein